MNTNNEITNKVGIERCDSYYLEALTLALKNAAKAAGLPQVSGKTVLLKPNILSDAAPEKAVTTHPDFLRAVIQLVWEWGASRILVGDSPGLQGPNFTPKTSGLINVIDETDAEWVDFTKGKMEINYPKAKVHRRFTVSSVLEEIDLLINLPKLKTHQLMYFTGALKNMFGLIPSIGKSPFHARYPTREAFASMIVDLNLAINKPVYAFMDAVIGMEGQGPGSGTPREVGAVIASTNFLAMDVAACTIMGYPPDKIPTNSEALERRIWLEDISEIEYPLFQPDILKIPDFEKIHFKKSRSQLLDFILPKPIKKLRMLNTVPAIDRNLCILCGDCIKICASEAMSFTGEARQKKVEIDPQRCIRCYCCHEICPAKAIEV